MKKNCGIARISDAKSGGKIKSQATMRSRLAHNLRGEELANDKRLWHLNKASGYIDILFGGETVKDVMKDAQNLYAKLEVKPTEGKSFARNSIQAVEVLMAYSPDRKDDINQAGWEENCLNFMKKKFGKRLISVVVHHDELTPHIHAMFVPITNEPGKKIRLNAGHWFNNVNKRNDKTGEMETLHNKMEEFQDEYFEAVSKKHGLRRGDKISDCKKEDFDYISATHEQVKAWRKENALSDFFAKIKSPSELKEAKKTIAGFKRKIRKERNAAKRDGKNEAVREFECKLTYVTSEAKRLAKALKRSSSLNTSVQAQLAKEQSKVKELEQRNGVLFEHNQELRSQLNNSSKLTR